VPSAGPVPVKADVFDGANLAAFRDYVRAIVVSCVDGSFRDRLVAGAEPGALDDDALVARSLAGIVDIEQRLIRSTVRAALAEAHAGANETFSKNLQRSPFLSTFPAAAAYRVPLDMVKTAWFVSCAGRRRRRAARGLRVSCY
jgi:hypothetical protein